jgi:hypothetical protein
MAAAGADDQGGSVARRKRLSTARRCGSRRRRAARRNGGDRHQLRRRVGLAGAGLRAVDIVETPFHANRGAARTSEKLKKSSAGLNVQPPFRYPSMWER